MNTIALLLNCSPDHELSAFDWGVAELSSILYRGVTYDHVEVDFLAGEVRFYRHWDDTDPVHNAPTMRRFINAMLQNCSCSNRIDPTPSLDIDEAPPHHSNLLPHEIPGIPAEDER